jgi:hypothetical protein
LKKIYEEKAVAPMEKRGQPGGFPCRPAAAGILRVM